MREPADIQPPDHQARRLTSLDGIRGVAALCVANFHFSYLFFPTNPILGAWLSVDIFFILSGMVLTHVYQDRIGKGLTGWTDFLVHRFARLYPLHFLTLGLILAINHVSFSFFYHGFHRGAVFPLDHFLLSTPPASRYFTGFLNVAMLQNVGFGGYAWDPPSWSICAEIVANIAWFWLLMRKRGSLSFGALIFLACLILISSSGLFLSNQWNNCYGILNQGLLRGLLGFLAGALCYRHLVPAVLRLSSWTVNAIGLGAAAITVHVFRTGTGAPDQAGIDYVLVLVVFPLLLASALHPRSAVNVFFSSKPLRWLGRISYSLYLLHWIIGTSIAASRPFWFPHLQGWRLDVVYLIACLVAAELSTRLWEEPWRATINGWYKARRTAAAATARGLQPELH